ISITTIFTAVGVMLGVAALAIVLAVMAGFEASLRQRILSLTPQVEVQSYKGAINDYSVIEARADAIPGVAGSDPYIIGQGMATSAHGISSVIVRGVEPSKAAVIAKLSGYVQQGSLNALGESQTSASSADARPSDGAVALGSTLAEKLKLKTGNRISLVVPLLAGKTPQLTTE